MEEAAGWIFVDVRGDAAARCADQLHPPRPDVGLGGQYRRQTARQARPLREAARQPAGPHGLNKDTRPAFDLNPKSPSGPGRPGMGVWLGLP
jgi:hypothetical protein